LPCGEPESWSRLARLPPGAWGGFSRACHKFRVHAKFATVDPGAEDFSSHRSEWHLKLQYPTIEYPGRDNTMMIDSVNFEWQLEAVSVTVNSVRDS
jgi:hypothetical protein